jgi:hypothetical protein
MTTEDIEQEALKMAPALRAKLAELLLDSLESLSEEEIETLWTERLTKEAPPVGRLTK